MIKTGDKKQTTIYMEPELYKALQIKAIQEDTTVTALIEKAVKDLLEKQ